MVNRKEESIRASLHRLLSEKIYTDIMIKTSDGSTEAHRAILAEKSPVFYNMFAHGFIEKESSKIEINDTSIEEFQAFLDYIYGSIPSSEFLKHRTALLKAADKYDVSELKTTCEESLIEDLSPSNVLESLEHAFLYQLLKLKRSCLDYLVSLGKTGGIPHGFHEFTKSANREALVELVSHLLIAMRNSNSCSDPEHVMTYKQEKRFFFHSDLD